MPSPGSLIRVDLNRPPGGGPYLAIVTKVTPRGTDDRALVFFPYAPTEWQITVDDISEVIHEV